MSRSRGCKGVIAVIRQLEHGPQTAREVAEALGWRRAQTADDYLLDARSLGWVKPSWRHDGRAGGARLAWELVDVERITN